MNKHLFAQSVRRLQYLLDSTTSTFTGVVTNAVNASAGDIPEDKTTIAIDTIKTNVGTMLDAFSAFFNSLNVTLAEEGVGITTTYSQDYFDGVDGEALKEEMDSIKAELTAKLDAIAKLNLANPNVYKVVRDALASTHKSLHSALIINSRLSRAYIAYTEKFGKDVYTGAVTASDAFIAPFTTLIGVFKGFAGYGEWVANQDHDYFSADDILLWESYFVGTGAPIKVAADQVIEATGGEVVAAPTGACSIAGSCTGGSSTGTESSAIECTTAGGTWTAPSCSQTTEAACTGGTWAAGECPAGKSLEKEIEKAEKAAEKEAQKAEKEAEKAAKAAEKEAQKAEQLRIEEAQKAEQAAREAEAIRLQKEQAEQAQAEAQRKAEEARKTQLNLQNNQQG